MSNDSSSILTILFVLLYFFFGKKKLIVKLDFKISDTYFQFGSRRIYYNTINKYKIHWQKGAGLKITLNSGEVLRLSSNDNFAKSEKFVEFCSDLDVKLEGIKSSNIKRVKSFFETKFGRNYLYALIIIQVGVLIYVIIKSIID